MKLSDALKQFVPLGPDEPWPDDTYVNENNEIVVPSKGVSFEWITFNYGFDNKEES